MKRIPVYRLIIIAVFVLMFHFGLVSATDPPKKGGVLPEIDLPIPKDAAHRAYLGLSGEGQFKIPQIKAKAVIIEIFSMYCPHCQKEAPHVNELYRAIEERADLKEKIKIIGIGIANSSYEVNVFREKYAVPFPLFPDKEMSITKMLGVMSTPTFIGVRMKKDGTHQDFYFKSGPLGDIGQFITKMVSQD